MARLNAKLRSVQGGIMHWCPGCAQAHIIYTEPRAGNEQPDWPPATAATAHSEGTRKHGSTGQEWEVRNRQWVRLKKPIWTWNRSIDRPTCTPSVRCFTRYDEMNVELPPGRDRTLCHYYLTDGNLEFCADSPHAFAGKTVPLPDIPENYGGGE